MRVSISPIREVDGSVVGATVIAHRVEESSDSELRAEVDLNRLILESSPVGMTFVDRSGSVVYANSKAEEILGLDRDAIASRRYDDPQWQITRCDGSPMPTDELPFERAVRGEPVRGVEHAIRWADGTVKRLSIDSVALHDATGALRGVASTIREIETTGAAGGPSSGEEAGR